MLVFSLHTLFFFFLRIYLFGWIFCLFLFGADLLGKRWTCDSWGELDFRYVQLNKGKSMAWYRYWVQKQKMLVRGELCRRALGDLLDPVTLDTVSHLHELMLSYLGNPICFGGVALISNSVAHREVMKPTVCLFSVSLKTDVFGNVQTDSS